MKKIYLTLCFSLLITSSALAVCPTNKPAKWTDGKCYTCEEVLKKIDELDNKKFSAHLSPNASAQEVKEFSKTVDDSFKTIGVLFEIQKVCDKTK